MPPRRAAAKAKNENAEPTAPNENKAVQPIAVVVAAPPSPVWRAPQHARSAADADLSVEQYLRQECERTVQQVMAHADARIAQFEFEAAQVRREMQAALGK